MWGTVRPTRACAGLYYHIVPSFLSPFLSDQSVYDQHLNQQLWTLHRMKLVTLDKDRMGYYSSCLANHIIINSIITRSRCRVLRPADWDLLNELLCYDMAFHVHAIQMARQRNVSTWARSCRGRTGEGYATAN